MNVLLIGRAKTGTTAAAKAIASALPNCEFVMEPKDLAAVKELILEPKGWFQRMGRAPEHRVIKIIYEHWRQHREDLEALVRNQTAIQLDRIVCMVRDPRDEFISRLHYRLYSQLTHHPETAPEAVDRWIELMRQKERDPQSLAALDMWVAYENIFRPGSRLRRSVPRDQGYLDFLQRHADTSLCLSYERFVEGAWDPWARYLGFRPLSAEVGPELQRVVRTRGAGQWKRFFTEQDVRDCRAALGRSMEGLGYTDWTLTPVTALDPAEHSGYLERLRREASQQFRLLRRPRPGVG